MKTFAEIKDGVIINVSIWEQTPDIASHIDITDIPNVGIGWAYVDGQFIEPVATPPVAVAPTLAEIVAQLQAEIAVLKGAQA